MALITNLSQLPDLQFTDGRTLRQIRDEMILDWEAEYYNQTGVKKTLSEGDPMRVTIYAQALRTYQLEALIDDKARQNFLAYARGDYLDQDAALRGITRLDAKPAKTLLHFTASAARQEVIPLPLGTRVTAGDNVFFATTVYAEIPVGQLTIDVTAAAVEPGDAGNNYLPGEINSIVDPVPYVSGVTNLTKPAGGADVESDARFANRAFLAPNGYSVAGPEGAYVFLALAFSQLISGVGVSSPAPGEVDVRVILYGGVLPDEVFLDDLETYLRDGNVRPLTDYVTVGAPDLVTYDLNITYYINRQDVAKLVDIRAAAEAAVEAYVDWQGTEIGRDIIPDELTRLVMAAGAKRLVITSPVFTAVQPHEIAKIGTMTVNYGGLEDG